MRVFKDLGFVEQLGSGMSRILSCYDRNIFVISEHYIKVIFPFSLSEDKAFIANGDINGDEKIILSLLKSKPDITAKEISDKTSFSSRKISRLIKNLRGMEIIVRVGSNRNGYWQINK